MDKTIFEKLIEQIDLESTIKSSIKSSLKERGIVEAYKSEPKNYKQATEFISEKAKKAHEDLYKGYVETLNQVSTQLDSARRSSDVVNPRHSDFRSLKLDECCMLNAKYLHELFFENAFDPASTLHMDELPYIKLARDWGSFEDWQRDFNACALACGSGWAVCGYHMHLKRYVNTIVSHHNADVMIGLYPIIVIDCWEHAYQRDYLNDKKAYVYAVMKELNWDVIAKRVERAEKIASILK